MKKFILILMIVTIGFVSKPIWEDSVEDLLPSSIKNPLVSAFYEGKDYFNNQFNQDINNIISSFDNLTLKSKDENIKKPDLKVSKDHLFSINNVGLGDSKKSVEQNLGNPKRQSQNEYGGDWTSYHESYHNFIMVNYDENDQVSALFTNQDLITSSLDIKLGTSKQAVQDKLGSPETSIRKGLVNYQINNEATYDTYKLNNTYITIFYDQHDDNTVAAIQIIEEDLEQKKQDIYAKDSPELRKGFEYQLFDITNATRVKHDLSVLEWNDKISHTARKHSSDMAKNDYFSHVSLENKTLADRMNEDNITYTSVGENIAYGQYSSIYAHQDLMNSLGHRKNILQKSFQNLGIGLAFNEEFKPYYTENFHSNSLLP